MKSYIFIGPISELHLPQIGLKFSILMPPSLLSAITCPHTKSLCLISLDLQQ